MFGNDPLQNMKGMGATGTAWGGSVNENRALRESTEVSNVSGLRGAYKLDLQGAERKDTIFGEKKDLEELRQEAENMDPSVQKDYMTVMAGTLSPEAYGKLAEDGFEIQQMDPEDIVDSSDKIKARMAEAGVVIHGYNDDLSSKQLEQITGSSAYAEEIRRAFSSREVPLNETGAKEAAETMEQSERLEPLSRGAKNYMVENGLAPTISNIYKAEHSGAAAGKNAGGGYVASGAYYTKGGSVEQGVPESLKEQAAAVIERSGEEVTEEGMDRAVRMLQDGLPLTEETYHHMSVLDQLELPLTTEAAADVAALAAYEGIPAENMDMSRKVSYAQEGAKIKAQVDAITEEDIAEVLDSGKELTIRNLSNAHEILQDHKDAISGKIKGDQTTDQTGGAVLQSADRENNIRFITARRQMEEIRLTMTVEINIKMIRRGVSIDTTDLSRLVDDLKSMEKEMMQRMFETKDDAEAQLRSLQYDNSLSAVSEIPGMPVSLVGDLLVRRSSVSIATLQEFTQEGYSSVRQYAAMQERYETVGTMPRADLGDSLRKAFDHADTLMKELGIENTEENARAVRILGYNSMEITAEIWMR